MSINGKTELFKGHRETVIKRFLIVGTLVSLPLALFSFLKFPDMWFIAVPMMLISPGIFAGILAYRLKRMKTIIIDRTNKRIKIGDKETIPLKNISWVNFRLQTNNAYPANTPLHIEIGTSPKDKSVAVFQKSLGKMNYSDIEKLSFIIKESGIPELGEDMYRIWQGIDITEEEEKYFFQQIPDPDTYFKDIYVNHGIIKEDGFYILKQFTDSPKMFPFIEKK